MRQFKLVLSLLFCGMSVSQVCYSGPYLFSVNHLGEGHKGLAIEKKKNGHIYLLLETDQNPHLSKFSFLPVYPANPQSASQALSTGKGSVYVRLNSAGEPTVCLALVTDEVRPYFHSLEVVTLYPPEHRTRQTTDVTAFLSELSHQGRLTDRDQHNYKFDQIREVSFLFNVVTPVAGEKPQFSRGDHIIRGVRIADLNPAEPVHLRGAIVPSEVPALTTSDTLELLYEGLDRRRSFRQSFFH